MGLLIDLVENNILRPTQHRSQVEDLGTDIFGISNTSGFKTNVFVGVTLLKKERKYFG